MGATYQVYELLCRICEAPLPPIISLYATILQVRRAGVSQPTGHLHLYSANHCATITYFTVDISDSWPSCKHNAQEAGNTHRSAVMMKHSLHRWLTHQRMRADVAGDDGGLSFCEGARMSAVAFVKNDRETKLTIFGNFYKSGTKRVAKIE